MAEETVGGFLGKLWQAVRGPRFGVDFDEGRGLTRVFDRETGRYSYPDLERPLIRGTTTHVSLPSLIAYAKRYATAGTSIFLVRGGADLGKVFAALDAHVDADIPGPHTHGASMELRHREEFRVWTEADQVLLPQARFVEMIRQWRSRIVQPEGSKLLEIIARLRVVKEGTYKAHEDPVSGSVDFIFDEKARAETGASGVKVPSHFVVRVRPIEGFSETIDLKLELMFRGGGGGSPVQLGFRIEDRVDLDDEVWDLAAGLVGKGFKDSWPIYEISES